MTLEGNAEAGITFTKGEAEAKALALRAEAFQKFNEAAVIQTVLGMLPEIVRAAAEPMSRIDSLTVLSNDGASELVRNTTRTVTEASATVKGLTGLDVPALISNAMGRATKNSPPGGPKPGGDGGGTAKQSRTGTARAPKAPGATVSEPIETVEGADAALARASEAIKRASSQAAAPVASAPLPPVPPLHGAGGKTADGASAGSQSVVPPITADMTAAEAAALLAEQLRRIPGIERNLTIPLAELDQRGPRPVRAAWQLAKTRVAARYGDMTVGELISKFPVN